MRARISGRVSIHQESIPTDTAACAAVQVDLNICSVSPSGRCRLGPRSIRLCSRTLISAQRLEDRRGRRGSGLPALDRLLGGGWPRAALCELSGRRSSGRTAILYAALARAHRGRRGDGAGRRRRRARSAARVRRPGSRCAACSGSAARPTWRPRRPIWWWGRAASIWSRSISATRGPRFPTAGWIRLQHGAASRGRRCWCPRRRAPRERSRRRSSSSAPARRRSSPTAPPLFAGLRARAVRARGAHEPARPESEEARCVSLAFSCRS